MHQGQPPVSLILRSDKSEKDRQSQKNKNEKAVVHNSGHRCLFLINLVREKLGCDGIGPIT
jgi:hypothetical protein